MALRADISVPAALATGALVYTIYQRGLPTNADVLQTEPGSPAHADVEVIRKQNAWMAAAVVGGVSLVAKDPTIFIVGGAMVVALDWFTRHANWTNPYTRRMDGVSAQDTVVMEPGPIEPNPYEASPQVF